MGPCQRLTRDGGGSLLEINGTYYQKCRRRDFDVVMTSGTYQSAVTADGSGATVYYKQIPAGLVMGAI